MPQKRNNPEPPEVMTWAKATPVLIVAGIFDAVRLMFEMFWFFGPALAALYCTAKVSGAVGTTIGGLACGAVAATVGAVGVEVIAPFGVVMAMATGFLGFLTLSLWILMKNARIFKANVTGGLWLGGGLLVSQIPFIGAFPAFTVILWRLYRTQIRVEKKVHQKWEKEQYARQLQERTGREAQFMQAQTNQLAPAEVY